MVVHAAGLDHRLYVLRGVLGHAAVGSAPAAVPTEERPAERVDGVVERAAILVASLSGRSTVESRRTVRTLTVGAPVRLDRG